MQGTSFRDVGGANNEYRPSDLEGLSKTGKPEVAAAEATKQAAPTGNYFGFLAKQVASFKLSFSFPAWMKSIANFSFFNKTVATSDAASTDGKGVSSVSDEAVPPATLDTSSSKNSLKSIFSVSIRQAPPSPKPQVSLASKIATGTALLNKISQNGNSSVQSARVVVQDALREMESLNELASVGDHKITNAYSVRTNAYPKMVTNAINDFDKAVVALNIAVANSQNPTFKQGSFNLFPSNFA